MKIEIHHLTALPSESRRERLFSRACLTALGSAARRPGILSLIFVSNPEIRKINRKHLSHDYNTDVISFPLTLPSPRGKGEGELPKNLPFGDVYVSVDQARIQAKELGHSHLKELLTLAVHGTLHLVGYDDHAASDRKRMFSRQDRIVKKLLG